MARDSGLTPEGETVTTKFTKKLHTVHMLYRSPDSIWSTKDKLEAVVLVVAPDTDMGEVVKFVSQMEMLFPSQKQFTRSTLDATEVKRLQQSVQGRNLLSAMSVKMPSTTRTGSQSGSTTSTLDITKKAKKVAPKKAKKAKKDKRGCCSCLPGKAAKGREEGDQGADDAATDAPKNQEMEA